MKSNERLKLALEALARQEVPETINLWPKLLSRLEKKELVTMKPAFKAIWIVLFVFLILLVVSGVAYALYTYFMGDAGLESVSQAGMVSEMNITALPTPLPTPTPLPPAVPLGKAQTLQGVTLTLNWVYLDDAWQIIGFSVQGLSENQRLGIPELDFGAIQPQAYSGAGMALLPEDGGLKGRYVVHQIVRDPQTYMIADTYVDLKVTIPLLDEHGNLLDTFRFIASHVPVHYQTFYGGSNLYSIRYAGLEARLDWILSTPQETRAKICYQHSGTPRFRLKAQGGQSRENFQTWIDVSALQSQQVRELPAEEGWRCAEAIFPPLDREVKMLDLIVDSLEDAEGKEISKPLEFFWAELPWQAPVPGIDPAPSQTNASGDIRITLLRVYVDALRAAVVYRLEGAQPHQLLDVSLSDVEGKPFFISDSGTISSNDDPNIFITTLTFGKPPAYIDKSFFSPKEPVQEWHFVGKLNFLISPDGQNQQVFTFDLDLPAYPAKAFNPAQSVVSEGLEMRLERLEISPSFTNAYLCYQKPSPADWMIMEKVTLQIGEDQAPISGYTMVFDEDFGEQVRPEWATLAGKVRCVKAEFALGHHGRAKTLTLRIEQLTQSVPEVIPEDQLRAANEKLRQQGIEVNWVTFSANGGGGGGPEIKQKPANMTDEEVIHRFYEALGYFFPGQWSFVLEIQP